MSQVTELGYLGIGVKDLEAWKNFATNIVGLLRFALECDPERAVKLAV